MANDKTAVAPKGGSGSTVTVGCKLPHGLHLDLYNTEGKTPEERAVVMQRVTLNGANASEIIGGHGITVGVDKAFFDKWMEMNKGSAAVRNELIFAHDKADDAVHHAQDNKDNKTGFEGLNPDKPAPGVEPLKEDKKK